jgi:hypothetical protein
MRLYYLVIIVAGFVFLPFSFSNLERGNSPQPEPFFAKIEIIEKNKDHLRIVGKFYNNTDSSVSLYYEMQTQKIGPSGKSISNQSGRPFCEPSSELILTTVGLNIDSETKYNISLKVFENSQLISSDSLNYIPEKK